MNRDGTATTSVTPAAMTGRRHKALAFVLAGGLLLAPAATQAIPLGLPPAQEEAAESSRLSNGQVIAQGVARLQPDEIAWTVRRIDVSGTEPTAVDTFQTGFVLSDAASVVVLGPNEQVLGVLDEGEAVFLPGGDAGGLAPWRDPEASLFELALVPGEAAAAGQTAGTVVGSPFAKPNGRDFEIELARTVLHAGDESVIPASRSGTPVLFVQTDGTSELTPPDGAPVEISAGQYAVLVGDVSARGSGSETAAFVVASIGERMPARGGSANARASGGANRANRANRGGGSADQQADRAARRAARQAARQQGGGGGGGGGASAEDRAARRAAREARRAEREANRGQTPVAGTPAAGTPTPVEEPQAATPSPTADPGAGTPAPPATPPAEEDEVIQDDTPAEEDDVEQDDEVVQDDDEVIQDDDEVIQDDDEVIQDDPPADEDEIIQDDEDVVQDEPPATEDEIVQDDESVIQDNTETGATTDSEQAAGDELTPEEGGVEPSSLAPDAPAEPEATLPVVEVPPADVPVEEPPVAEAPVDQAPVVEEAPVAEAPVEQAPVEQAPIE